MIFLVEDPKMSKIRYFVQAAVVIYALGVANQSLTHAAIVGPFDDFEDGTTAGWIHGLDTSPTFPENIASDGPAGADDGYLRVSAMGSFGPGSRLVALNRSQWTGDFVSPGVTTILADVRNPSLIQVDLRVAFQGAGEWFISDQPVSLPAGADWQSVALPITDGAIRALGEGDYASTMSSVTEMRLLHNPEFDFLGQAIVAEFHVDNLRIAPLADFDQNTVVDGNDLAIWEGAYGSTGADADLDGDSDGTDYLIWQRQFSPPPAIQAVPEPTALAAACVAGTVLGALRLRSRDSRS